MSSVTDHSLVAKAHSVADGGVTTDDEDQQSITVPPSRRRSFMKALLGQGTPPPVSLVWDPVHTLNLLFSKLITLWSDSRVPDQLSPFQSAGGEFEAPALLRRDQYHEAWKAKKSRLQQPVQPISVQLQGSRRHAQPAAQHRTFSCTCHFETPGTPEAQAL